MRERWFYCPDLSVREATLSPEESGHVLASLRLECGAEITLFDARGNTATGVLCPAVPEATGGARRRRPRGDQLRAVVRIQHVSAVPAPARHLTVVVAGCKGPRMSWLIEKCTELGVHQLRLTEFERSVVHADERHAERFERAVIEACKQARRARAMEVRFRPSLPAALEDGDYDALLVAVPGDDSKPWGRWLAQHPQTATACAVVGPEGGLSEDELNWLLTRGATRIGLGSNILRVETAAAAVAAVWAAH